MLALIAATQGGPVQSDSPGAPGAVPPAISVLARALSQIGSNSRGKPRLPTYTPPHDGRTLGPPTRDLSPSASGPTRMALESSRRSHLGRRPVCHREPRMIPDSGHAHPRTVARATVNSVDGP